MRKVLDFLKKYGLPIAVVALFISLILIFSPTLFGLINLDDSEQAAVQATAVSVALWCGVVIAAFVLGGAGLAIVAGIGFVAAAYVTYKVWDTFFRSKKPTEGDSLSDE